MDQIRAEDVVARAGPLAWTTTHLAIERGGRIEWAAARERVTSVRVRERSKWGHPALAILLAAVIILPFSWAMLMLARHNSWRVFVEQLLLALAITVVVAGVTFMSVFRRIRTGKVVEVRAGERKIAVPVSEDEAGLIDAELRRAG